MNTKNVITANPVTTYTNMYFFSSFILFVPSVGCLSASFSFLVNAKLSFGCLKSAKSNLFKTADCDAFGLPEQNSVNHIERMKLVSFDQPSVLSFWLVKINNFEKIYFFISIDVKSDRVLHIW